MMANTDLKIKLDSQFWTLFEVILVFHDRRFCQIIWQIFTQGRAKKIRQKLPSKWKICVTLIVNLNRFEGDFKAKIRVSYLSVKQF